MAGRPPSRRLHVRNLPPYAFPARTLVPSLTRSRSLLRLDMEATLWKRFLPILTVIVYILLALVGLVALTTCVFLWMVSTRTRQDSKIFQERFDGWRKTRG